MKSNLKDKWVSALRSGDYRQGRGHLKQKDSDKQVCYCCLGVLAEIAEPGELIPVGWGFRFRGNSGIYLKDEKKFLYLPEKDQRALSNMNDIKKASFFEIANWIEKNIPAEEI
jgi:hypothetical protein